jgi:hypothetical protein
MNQLPIRVYAHPVVYGKRIMTEHKDDSIDSHVVIWVDQTGIIVKPRFAIGPLFLDCCTPTSLMAVV